MRTLEHVKHIVFPGQSVRWQSSNRRPDADFGQKRVLDEEAPGKLYAPPPKTVTDKNRRKAPDFGFRLLDAPHMGDMDENNPKHYWISQLLVVPDVFHFDSHVDLAYSNRTLCVGGLS